MCKSTDPAPAGVEQPVDGRADGAKVGVNSHRRQQSEAIATTDHTKPNTARHPPPLVWQRYDLASRIILLDSTHPCGGSINNSSTRRTPTLAPAMVVISPSQAGGPGDDECSRAQIELGQDTDGRGVDDPHAQVVYRFVGRADLQRHLSTGH